MPKMILGQQPDNQATNSRLSLNDIAEFHYRVSWRSHNASPGFHYSTHSGGHFEFHRHAPLISHPDPRNLDIQASLHDPFGQFVVRTFRQRSTIPVFVIADLSASMTFKGAGYKQETLAWFSACAAHSAFRTGDPFGFLGCGEHIHEHFFFPLRWYKGVASELFNRLGNQFPFEKSADGMLDTPPLIGRKKSLVFLVSDFHFSLETLAELLQNLEIHDVVPVVLWDRQEQVQPKWGITRLHDPESGNSRLLIMRPGLQRRIRTACAQRLQSIIDVCSQFDRSPFVVLDAFNPEELTRYFLHEKGFSLA